MPLTDTSIRNAKPKEKAYKLADERGLFLFITSKGNKLWRFKYRFLGKEKLLSIGAYPDVTLAKARAKRDDARKLLVDDIDPSENRKAIKASQTAEATNSFETIAREWFNRNSAIWAPSHAEKIIRRLERDIFPWLGNNPIASIRAPDILSSLRRIESRGALETAHRTLQTCSQIFRYAIATGRAQHNPVPDLKGALPAVKPNHHAAITEPVQIAALLRAIDSYQGTFVTTCALKLAPLVFVRPGELRAAEWSEINFDTAEWNIPAERMKMRQPLLVPLSTQAITILRDLHPLTGRGRYVFPCFRSPTKPMSNNAILAALRRMGFSKDEMTGHGFRAMARTVLDEVLSVRPDYIEHQLAHAVRDPNGRAYNRTAHISGRRKMMQTWADYLEKLKTKRNVNDNTTIYAVNSLAYAQGAL